MEEHIVEQQFKSGVIGEDTIAYGKKKLLECYHKMLQINRFYMDAPDSVIIPATIWDIGTYFHKQFNSYPILYINAMRGSGKSRFLALRSWLQYQGNGQVLNNPSEAVIFRTAKTRGVILDEIERLGGKDKGILQELLNSCYKKGSQVSRMKKVKTKEGESQEVESFDLFTPVALANINGIDEVLQDRALTIRLEKSSNQAVTKIMEDFDQNLEIRDIKASLVSLCRVVTLKNNIKDWNCFIKRKYNDITTLTSSTTLNNITAEQEVYFDKIDACNFSGRNLEIIFPLLEIANLIDESVFETVLPIFKSIIETKRDNEYIESKDVQLYEFIAKECKLYQIDAIYMKDLVRLFREWLGEDMGQDPWLNEKWMGRALERLNLTTSKVRMSKGRKVTLDIVRALDKLKLFKEDDHGTA